jgi:hypothetical protein
MQSTAVNSIQLRRRPVLWGSHTSLFHPGACCWVLRTCGRGVCSALLLRGCCLGMSSSSSGAWAGVTAQFQGTQLTFGAWCSLSRQGLGRKDQVAAVEAVLCCGVWWGVCVCATPHASGPPCLSCCRWLSGYHHIQEPHACILLLLVGEGAYLVVCQADACFMQHHPASVLLAGCPGTAGGARAVGWVSSTGSGFAASSAVPTVLKAMQPPLWPVAAGANGLCCPGFTSGVESWSTAAQNTTLYSTCALAHQSMPWRAVQRQPTPQISLLWLTLCRYVALILGTA